MSPLVVALWLLNVTLDTVGQLAFKAAAVMAALVSFVVFQAILHYILRQVED